MTPLLREADQQSLATRLEQAGLHDLARQIRDCGTRYSVALCRRCYRHQILPTSCGHTICPRCAARLAARRAAETRAWASGLNRPKHIVLTRRSSHRPLLHLAKDTIRAFARLRRTKLGQRIRGGLWRLEVTYGAKGWHVHLHILADVCYLPQDQLAEAWARIVAQEFAIVWIRDASEDSYLAEVTKYACKPASLDQMPLDALAELATTLPRLRTFAQFGTLRRHHQAAKALAQESAPEPLKCECGCQEFDWFTDTEWEYLVEIEGCPEPLPIPTTTRDPPDTQPEPQPQVMSLLA